MPSEARHNALVRVKVAHTVVWAAVVGCILAIPVAAWRGHHRTAGWLAGIVAVQAGVLIFNRWVCPLTTLAARYTDDRRANFDIYLPEWLAQYNKLIFGALYIAGGTFALARWSGVLV
jgi:type III secretory pathway component EscS